MMLEVTATSCGPITPLKGVATVKVTAIGSAGTLLGSDGETFQIVGMAPVTYEDEEGTQHAWDYVVCSTTGRLTGLTEETALASSNGAADWGVPGWRITEDVEVCIEN